MPPARTQKRNTQTHASSSKSKLDNEKRPTHKRKQASGDANAQAVPGVQKVKAALRQTKRLLAKDKLAADVRVETERRLKALEADLAKAERARKEKTFAQRYHGVKFFERQKVTRKLNKMKRELESCTDKKERKKIEEALFELRVDLNYIIHYPKLMKYISLLPPEVRQKSGDDKGKVKASEEQPEEQTEEKAAATNLRREEIRSQVREAMEKGELSAEPEVEDRKTARRSAAVGDVGGKEKSGKKGGKEGTKSSGPKRVPEINEDEFFDNDSEESEGSGVDDDGNAMDED